MNWLTERFESQKNVSELADQYVAELLETYSRVHALNLVNQDFYNTAYRTQRQKEVLIQSRRILMEQI